MAEDQQGSNKRVTSSPCFLSSLFPSSPFPIFPSTATTFSPRAGDTHSALWPAPARTRARETAALTSQACLHRWWQASLFLWGAWWRWRRRRIGWIYRVVYKLEEGWRQRTLGQKMSSVFHFIGLSRRPTIQHLLHPTVVTSASIQRTSPHILSIVENTWSSPLII